MEKFKERKKRIVTPIGQSYKAKNQHLSSLTRDTNMRVKRKKNWINGGWGEGGETQMSGWDGFWAGVDR